MCEKMISKFEDAFAMYARLYVSFLSCGKCYRLYSLAHEIIGLVYMMYECDVIDHDTCKNLISCINLEEIRFIQVHLDEYMAEGGDDDETC